MSLINDALKRARQTPPRPAPLSAPGAPLRPVENARPTGAPASLIWLGVGALLAGLAALALILFALRGGAAKDRALAANAPPPTTTPAPRSAVPEAPPPPAPPAAQSPAPASVRGVGPATAAPLDANPPSRAPAAPARSAAVVPNRPPALTNSPPTLPRLQGIFYRPDRPAALLEDRTVMIGESSGEFLVVAIDAQSVTLVQDGVTNILRLR